MAAMFSSTEATQQLEAQQKLEILKVVDVWRQRRVYQTEFVSRLHARLVEESGLKHLLSGQKAQSDRVRIHTSDLKQFKSGLLYSSKTGETILDLECSQWVSLAQKLENSAENRAKIIQLEKRLNSMLMRDDESLYDEVEA